MFVKKSKYKKNRYNFKIEKSENKTIYNLTYV